ncbi:hypothetical protein M569_17372, partial [Genlisea aurea]
SKALNGVHGVQVLPHSPFSYIEVKRNGDFDQSSSGSFSWSSQLLPMQKLWQQRPPCLRPIRCCLNGDRNLAEKVVNVLTSIPFIFLGFKTPRKNNRCKIYASSLVGVGVASSLYHASNGEWRKYLRWADYTMIATASVCLSRALKNENSKALMAASAVLLPIQPLMVSAVHTGIMEASI